MGNHEWQTLPPSLAHLSVRAEVVNGDDEVLLDADGTSEATGEWRLRLTGNQAKALGEALYLAGASASWAAFRRRTEGG